VTELEHAEWLAAQERPAALAPLLSDARAAFERLGADPWLERAALVESPQPAGLPHAGVTPA
jgi:hypothetical protein